MAEVTFDPEKTKRIENLIKSLRELDNCIEPFQEQRKDLRKSYLENGWLSKEEFTLAKKAYNALKNKVDMDDLATFVEIAKKGMPSE